MSLTILLKKKIQEEVPRKNIKEKYLDSQYKVTYWNNATIDEFNEYYIVYANCYTLGDR